MSLIAPLEEWQSLTWSDVLRIQADGKVRCGEDLVWPCCQ